MSRDNASAAAAAAQLCGKGSAFNLVMTLKWQRAFINGTDEATGLSVSLSLSLTLAPVLLSQAFDWHMLSLNEG